MPEFLLVTFVVGVVLATSQLRRVGDALGRWLARKSRP
jgi:Sec-independent protein translocase protein TatA